MSRSDDGFLGRWSRRKRAQEQAEAAPRPESEAEAPPAPEPALAPEAGTDAVPLTEEELAALPRIEDLVEGSDIKAFLRAGVPRALRSAALRRAWMLTPAIRDYKNPAVDYAWDWNTPGGVPGDGCAPSPERAAQMLRDLVTPRRPADPPGPVVAASEPAAEDEAEVGPHGSASGASDDATLARDAASDALPEDDALQPPEQAAGRRRHGGALPS